MKIIDIHSHIHMRETLVQEQENNLLRDMERFGIERRLISAIGDESTEKKNRCIEELIARHPKELIGCGVINPKEENALEETRRICANSSIRAVEFNSLEDSYYPDICPWIDGILDVLEGRGLLVKVFAGVGSRAMPHQWIGHAKRHPGLNFLILHMACFDYGYGCIDLAREYPNVYLETSNQYEVQILKKAVEQLVPDKLVFGSCYPERLTKCSINIFDMFDVDEFFRKKVYRENALKMLHLK